MIFICKTDGVGIIKLYVCISQTSKIVFSHQHYWKILIGSWFCVTCCTVWQTLSPPQHSQQYRWCHWERGPSQDHGQKAALPPQTEGRVLHVWSKKRGPEGYQYTWYVLKTIMREIESYVIVFSALAYDGEELVSYTDSVHFILCKQNF